MFKLPPKAEVASFDIDCQNTFTPLCPLELPVEGGDKLAPELNEQAAFASVRLASRDAHSLSALWLTDAQHPIYSPVEGDYPDMDIRWPAHAIIGTMGFEFIPGLEEVHYDFQAFKGIERDKHPYGACYHDLGNTISTGVIEFLQAKGIKTVICGGLATDYCVKNTVLQLREAGFEVVLNMAACRGIAPETILTALEEMDKAGVVFVKSASELEQE